MILDCIFTYFLFVKVNVSFLVVTKKKPTQKFAIRFFFQKDVLFRLIEIKNVLKF